jgi:Protein of unknown function (DUF3108)
MNPIKLIRTATLGLGLLFAAGLAVAAPAVPKGFVAKYEVLKDGAALGEATITLKSTGGGVFEYSNQTHGTSGIAAMLGANVDEISHFRWKGSTPEAVDYDYKMVASIKAKQRHLSVDWAKSLVSVSDSKGDYTYAAAPGMVERNTAPLALGVALREGKQQIALPVAVMQNVEMQQFKVAGKESVKVPAGTFNAVRVERSDADRGFNAWYVPEKFPIPVKLAQKDGGNLTMQLISYTPQ